MSSSKNFYIHFVASIMRSLALNRALDHKFYMLRNTQEKHGIGRIVVEKDYLEALDCFFSTLRNICREDRLDAVSRLKLLEFIKMRAMRWRTNENVTNYFTTKLSQLEVAFMPYRVNGQYIMEGLASSFLFALGGLGFVILDHTHNLNTPKLNRILLICVAFICILVSFFTCWIFMRMKLPGFQDLSSTPQLPSRQQVEYVLIRTLFASKLVCEAINYSRESFCYIIQKLKVGHLILDLTMATSIIARLNILLRATLEQLSSMYKQVLFWRYKVKKGGFQWVLVNWRVMIGSDS